MISFYKFKQNRFLILESRFEDTYWFRITYEDLLDLVETNTLIIKKSLFLVTKTSENHEVYNDEFLNPVTIYLDKEKTLSFLETNKYKTSISKGKNLFAESEEDPTADIDNAKIEDFNFDAPENKETSELDEPLTNDEPSEQPKETPEEELPDEIVVNEKSIKFDPDIILGIEVSLKKLYNLLDNEFTLMLKKLKLRSNFVSKNDNDKRDELAKIVIEKIDEYCSNNNITKNYIKE